jgi:hypothetical protein
MHSSVSHSSRAQAASTRFHRLSLERIAQASGVIDPIFRNSPQFETQPVSEQLGCRLVVKIETLNPIRSFKARGAQFLTAQLPAQSHLVCATAGTPRMPPRSAIVAAPQPCWTVPGRTTGPICWGAG